MPCAFYGLYSAVLDNYYIGHTCQQLEQRIQRHLSNHRGYTARAKDWVVVHEEQYPDKATAYLREREVKGWKSRQKLVELIKQ